jgi:hypothetical protein
MKEKPQTLAAGIIDRRAKLIPAKTLAVRRQLKEQRGASSHWPAFRRSSNDLYCVTARLKVRNLTKRKIGALEGPESDWFQLRGFSIRVSAKRSASSTSDDLSSFKYLSPRPFPSANVWGSSSKWTRL